PADSRSPNTLEYLGQRKFDLVINIPKNAHEEELTNDYLIRREAADFGIPLITNIQLAQRFVEALSKKRVAELQIKSWQEYASLEPTPVRVISPQDDDVRPASIASAGDTSAAGSSVKQPVILVLGPTR